METSFGISVILVISRKVPYDQCLITAAGEKHVGVFEAGCKRSHPRAIVSRLCGYLRATPEVQTILSDPRGFHALPIVPPCWAMSREEGSQIAGCCNQYPHPSRSVRARNLE